MEYRDDGDVLLEDGRIVQAKQRPTIDFQSLGDFPHDFVIVDRKHNVDLADRAASHYFIWNASLTGFLLLACRPSRKYWVPSWIDSAARGRAAWYYIAAIHHFEYHHAE